MTKLNFARLFTFVIFTLIGAAPMFAQQAISDEKKALIREFREATGTLTFKATAASTPVDFPDPFTPMVDRDKELTDAQKTELKKLAADAKARMDKQIQDFMVDEASIRQIFDDAAIALFDKTFSEAELREGTAFYKTATGQKALKFLPNVIKQMVKDFGEAFGRKLQDFITPKMRSEVEEIKKRIQEAKVKETGT